MTLESTRKKIDKWEKANPLNPLGKLEKWLIGHSFVFIWIPSCFIWEIFWFSLFGSILILGGPLVALFSWDGHASRNTGKLVDGLNTLYCGTSVLFHDMARPGD